MRISVAKSDRRFSVKEDQSVLDAALSAGMNLPHGCKGGNCGACRARLLQGTVHYPGGAPLGLSAAEVAEGFVLLCQARALDDWAIEVLEISFADEAMVKRLPGRIERIVELSHDVIGLFLRLPAAEPLWFEAGQYIDILLQAGRRRSFSIASPPHDSRLIELHVKRVPGGELTEWLFAPSSHRALLSLEGPLGHFYYRPDTEAPMLLVGGGTGFAPLKSILRHVIENALPRTIVMYWGVRSERDLYAHEELEALSLSQPNLCYTAVLSEPEVGWTGRRGWVHEVVLSDLNSLAGYDIYACGPPSMIAAIRTEFPRHGANPARLFCDSFDYAPDTIARQRLSAVTKS